MNYPSTIPSTEQSFSKRRLLMIILLFFGVMLHPSAGTDSNTLETRFGCSELSVLADEMLRRDPSRETKTPLCPAYTRFANMLDANKGDADLVLQEFEDAFSPGITVYTEQCDYLQEAVFAMYGSATCDATYSMEKTVSQSEHWTSCPATTYECVEDRDMPYFTELEKEYPSVGEAYEIVVGYGAKVSVDSACLHEVINDVIVFQDEFEAIGEFEAMSETCQEQTMKLERNSQLEDAFNAIEVDSTEKEVNGATTNFANYLDTTTAPFAAYESKCQSLGGTYVELNLKADCKGWDIGSSSSGPDEAAEQYDINLVVVNRPRCYGIDCTSDDDVGLLEEFTLRETERRWESEMEDTFWICQEQAVDTVEEQALDTVEDQPSFSVCGQETSLVGEISVVRSTNNAIVPDIEQKKGKMLFFISVDIENEYVATFEESSVTKTAAYESKCSEGNGIYSIADDFVLQCVVGGQIGAQETLKYEVSGFPVCLSTSCSTGSEERDAAEAALMAEKLVFMGSLSSSSDYDCSYSTTSGALSLLMTSVPQMLSLVFMVCGSMWFLY